eukprot:CAMPEP_0170199258 /NCGR_PEP_ID=MMETSP0040_2-20121228/69204_1 /TAXON_ID=641309 /ORGANISM="Lotharella oceanica, Strain CCMP622" /LENGTH=266 /DNA_ID=CAMNT_0010449359 /DNA_START=1915 /DNA_END=2712 /DNA_ORIENTATION=-
MSAPPARAIVVGELRATCHQLRPGTWAVLGLLGVVLVTVVHGYGRGEGEPTAGFLRGSSDSYDNFKLSKPCMEALVADGSLRYQRSRGFDASRRRGWHMFAAQDGDFKYHLSCHADTSSTAHVNGTVVPVLKKCHITARRQDDFKAERGRHTGSPGIVGVRYVCDARAPCVGQTCPFSYFHRKPQRTECYNQLQELASAYGPCLINAKAEARREPTLQDDLQDQSVPGVLWTLCGAGVGALLHLLAKYMHRKDEEGDDEDRAPVHW